VSCTTLSPPSKSASQISCDTGAAFLLALCPFRALLCLGSLSLRTHFLSDAFPCYSFILLPHSPVAHLFVPPLSSLSSVHSAVKSTAPCPYTCLSISTPLSAPSAKTSASSQPAAIHACPRPAPRSAVTPLDTHMTSACPASCSRARRAGG
jgi:hypothetical protein